MQTLEVNFYYDAGHGWYQVHVDYLKELGIADKISEYSYISRSGIYVYLEEDADATLFFKTLDAQNITYKIVEHDHGDRSMVRSMKRFKAVR